MENTQNNNPIQITEEIIAKQPLLWINRVPAIKTLQNLNKTPKHYRRIGCLCPPVPLPKDEKDLLTRAHTK